MTKKIDLGDGHSISFFTVNGVDVVGGIESHPSLKDTDYHKAGEECSGVIYFDVPSNTYVNRHKWAVESWDPLTLSPSVLCTLCGNHGFIREGKWLQV